MRAIGMEPQEQNSSSDRGHLRWDFLTIGRFWLQKHDKIPGLLRCGSCIFLRFLIVCSLIERMAKAKTRLVLMRELMQ